jgi:HK97 gp10 family phage protein
VKIVTKVEGLEGVLDALKKLPPEVVSKNGGPVRRALRTGARVIVKEAKQRVPVGSGYLRDSLGVFRAKFDGKGERVTVRPGGFGMRQYVKNRANIRAGRATQSSAKSYEIEDLPGVYGRFLEYGTSKMAARPWMRPAFAASAQAAIKAARVKLLRDIARITRKLGLKAR